MKTKIMFLCCLMFSLLVGAGLGRADEKSDPCKDVPPLFVTRVEGPVELGRDLFVTVKNLPEHIKKCGKDPSKFKLYLNWIKIDQVDATLVAGRKESKNEVDAKKAGGKKEGEIETSTTQTTVKKEGDKVAATAKVSNKEKTEKGTAETGSVVKKEGDQASAATQVSGKEEVDKGAAVEPDSDKQKSDEGTLLFKIKHGDSDEAKKAWAALLGKPFAKDRGIKTGVIVSVGYDDEAPVAFESKKKTNSTLMLVDPVFLGMFIAVMLVVLILLIWLSVSSGILRGPFRDIPVRERPFSLGRTQMAFWFFLVACSYFFIWLITGNLNTITGSVLTLIGISSATYLSSAALSSDKDKQALANRQKLRKDINALQVTLDELGKRIKKTHTSKTKKDLEKQEMEKTIEKRLLQEQLTSLTDNLKSNGFLKDLVSDANGVSLNRFQIAVWTGVLGIIFVISVFKSMAMPQFDETLLALMGISGGTYIGFKFPGGKAGQDKKDQKDKPS